MDAEGQIEFQQMETDYLPGLYLKNNMKPLNSLEQED